MKLHKKKLKILKMEVVNKSRHGVVAATSNLGIKGKVEQPEPTHYNENPFSLQ